MEQEQKLSVTSLRKRLLSDIKDIQTTPYPGIELHVHDDLLTACLALEPEDEPPLHLTFHFSDLYPLEAPQVTIQSNVSHPNVFGNSLCINLLTTDEGYTPAYTLKGICIQLLSFFGSDKVEQMWGEHGGLVDRKQWQQGGRDGYGLSVVSNTYQCNKCGFGSMVEQTEQTEITTTATPTDDDTPMPDSSLSKSTDDSMKEKKRLKDLPKEILLLICDYLDDESLLLAGGAGGELEVIGALIESYNIIRTRELVCFVFKTGFNTSNLGVGVLVKDRNIESEFDTISHAAYKDYNVRRSIQGIPFDLWLPLPLAQKHWDRVKSQAHATLNAIAQRTNLPGGFDKTLYHFMNGVVVRLSAASDEAHNRSTRSTRILSGDGAMILSTLTHASEKAIESYFHLFHLLLCLTVDRPSISRDANSLIKDFIAGQRSKDSCPNIGHLLIAILISDVEVTDDLVKAIINETVIRNVVWMLEAEPRGKGMPELSFLETNAISEYRLQRTFEAGKTGYKLLMFLNLMRKVVRSARNNEETGEKMTLLQLRDNLFERHGAPPTGAAARMAEAVRTIQKVNTFPQFLSNMGMKATTATSFTTFLRKTVEDSVKVGYSKFALTQQQALHLRMQKDSKVEVPEGMEAQPVDAQMLRRVTFFPQQGGRGGRGGGRGGRGGRGRGRDRRW